MVQAKKSKKSTSWFDVDREGLRALQKGKPKTFIINELTQNAWDQNITYCNIIIKSINKSEAIITVEDDDPNGFSDISHAYTLFSDTYKRRDPTKRGRFNMGEKQVLAICTSAEVSTTTGTVVFDDKGRNTFPEAKTKKGSKITVFLDATPEEVSELINHAKKLLVPEHFTYTVNGEKIEPPTIVKSFEAKLDTEILDDEIMKIRPRTTKINLVDPIDEPMIYEMGIPIAETDCQWSIDIQQKIPLNIDRNSIRHAYRQDLYAEVLNNTYEDVTEASSTWVRMATKDNRTTDDAINGIMKKRFGEKFAIANPSDKYSIDKALANGYNVIYGSELSKEEWERVKPATDVKSTTQLFNSRDLMESKPLDPNSNMAKTASYARRIAKRLMGIDIKVVFVNAPQSNVLACYGNRTLTFNKGKLGRHFFDKPISKETTDLIIHELGHENGWHVEIEYHKLLTKLGAELTMLALTEPEFFEAN
jgi:hypothetical protein